LDGFSPSAEEALLEPPLEALLQLQAIIAVMRTEFSLFIALPSGESPQPRTEFTKSLNLERRQSAYRQPGC
jgi:hypothetical protein